VRILVAEDEASLGELLRYNLEKEGFAVQVTTDGEEALIEIHDWRPDLLILDWMMPGLSGIEVCRRLRMMHEGRALPVLMLTARGEDEDRIRGLMTGADDYVTKPFSMSELIARIRALLRRSSPGLGEDVAAFGDIRLDRGRKRVTRAGRDIRLGPTEFRLLDVLIRRPGRVFSREQILDMVWSREAEVELRTVDVHVGRLRRALTFGHERDPIRTVRAEGYALDEGYST
jgi:two-component system phosphate regulon response regulator PhoB